MSVEKSAFFCSKDTSFGVTGLRASGAFWTGLPWLLGSSVSSTIARRSALVRQRFFLTGAPTCCNCEGVSTIPLCGHKFHCPHTHHPHPYSRGTHGGNRTLSVPASWR